MKYLLMAVLMMGCPLSADDRAEALKGESITKVAFCKELCESMDLKFGGMNIPYYFSTHASPECICLAKE